MTLCFSFVGTDLTTRILLAEQLCRPEQKVVSAASLDLLTRTGPSHALSSCLADSAGSESSSNLTLEKGVI